MAENIILAVVILAAAGYVGYVLTGVFRGKKGGAGGCNCVSAVCPYAGKNNATCEKCASYVPENGELVNITPEEKQDVAEAEEE